jgi:hypothetical protein
MTNAGAELMDNDRRPKTVRWLASYHTVILSDAACKPCNYVAPAKCACMAWMEPDCVRAGAYGYGCWLRSRRCAETVSRRVAGFLPTLPRRTSIPPEAAKLPHGPFKTVGRPVLTCYGWTGPPETVWPTLQGKWRRAHDNGASRPSPWRGRAPHP